MTQKQVELQKLILMEQEREKKDQMNLKTNQIIPKKMMNYPLSETMKSLEKELNLDIFLDDKDLKKKKKKYSSTKVKARNFLTNISYSGIKKVDYENRSFVIDIFAYLILYFNPYNVNGKFENETERDYVNILWSMMMPQNFYFFVSKEENSKLLNKRNAKFQDAVEVVTLFIEDDSNENVTQEIQYGILKQFLVKYIKMYQLIFANLFPKLFGKYDNRGIESNIEFNSFYSNYLNQKSLVDWQKNNQYWEEQERKVTASLEVNNNESLNEIDFNNVDEPKEEKFSLKKKKKRNEKKEIRRKINGKHRENEKTKE